MKYVTPSDICVYSIDEVLMDVTNYLPAYKLTPRELARKIVLDVLDTTGVTATAGIGANLYLAAEDSIPTDPAMEQLDLFSDFESTQREKEAEAVELARERKLQETMLGVKSKFGKNAILKGTNLIDGATAAERNGRIGGHKA